MRHLLLFFLIIPLLLSYSAESITADNSTTDREQEWIQSIINDHEKTIMNKDFIFYWTGHHGLVWSLIASDSSGIYLYNGTTRKKLENSDEDLPDSLSFIKSNIKTITWGFDSLANASPLLSPLNDTIYNPFYSELYVIKDGKIALNYNFRKDYYSGADSTVFRPNLSRLVYLMLWLAAPDCRQYMSTPCDTLLNK